MCFLFCGNLSSATPVCFVTRVIPYYWSSLFSFSQLGRTHTTERTGRGGLTKMPLVDQRRLDNRLERFDTGGRSPRSLRSSQLDDSMAFQSKPMVDENGVVDWDAITIKGTCRELEKDYLRLTQVGALSRHVRICLGGDSSSSAGMTAH